MNIQGLSQNLPDNLKIKKTQNVSGKVDLFYSKYQHGATSGECGEWFIVKMPFLVEKIRYQR